MIATAYKQRKPEYRFKCVIVDTKTDETVITGSTYLSTVSEIGECESIEMEVGSMLRAFERFIRDEYERDNYPQEEETTQ